MNLLLSFCFITSVAGVTACGTVDKILGIKSSTPAAASPAAASSSSTVSGTCNRVSLASNCTEYMSESAAALAVYESGCPSYDTWSSGLNCPASGVLGVCTMFSDPGNNEVFYSTPSAAIPSGWTANTAASACADFPGIWTPAE